MPCYCDIPDKLNQFEIEKRCKTRMYFDARSILTRDYISKADKLGIDVLQVTLPDPNTALCNICKVLSQEQMQSISAYYYEIEWKHKTLWDWYQKHCEDDKQNE